LLGVYRALARFDFLPLRGDLGGQHLAVLQQARDLREIEHGGRLGLVQRAQGSLLGTLEGHKLIVGLAQAGLQRAKLLPRAIREAGPVVEDVLKAEHEPCHAAPYAAMLSAF
jgi:hypothetical protein